MLTTEQKQKVSAFLFNAGHSQVRFVGKHIVYRDQTKGQLALDKLIESDVILKHVENHSLPALDRLFVYTVMRQIDPTRMIWRWDDWSSLPDQVYENSSWTNNPTKLLEILEDNVFENFKDFRIRPQDY